MIAAAALTAQTPQTLPQAEPVSVDVSVTRAGQPVAGLTAADFTLRDSGVGQTIEVVSAQSLPLDVVLVLDTSASLRGSGLEQLKDAARKSFAALRPDDQGALLTFSQNVVLRAGLTADRALLTRAADSMSAQGSTSLADAAFAALAMRRRAPRTLVLIFTDGDDVASWLPAADVVRVAQRFSGVVSGVMIPAPGHSGAQIGKAFAGRDKAGADARTQISKWLSDDPFLYRAALLPVLALETGGETVQAADATRLTAAFVDLIARHATRYVIRYVPNDAAAAAGWHPIQVEVRGGGEVTARTGYVR